MVRLTGALLLAALLAACSRPPDAAGVADAGEALYRTYCIACHLEHGTAVPNLRPALAGSALVNGDPEPLARWVMYGVPPANRPPSLYPPVMPRYGRLNDADLALLLSYLRSHFGNTGATVDAALVARVRAAGH